MPAYFHHRFKNSTISLHDESYFYNKRRNFRLRLGCCEVSVTDGLSDSLIETQSFTVRIDESAFSDIPEEIREKFHITGKMVWPELACSALSY